MQHFNELAKVWETPEKVELYKSYALKVKNKLSNNTYTNILEIGCGTGLLGQNFITENVSYLGIDTSSEMLNVLKSKFEQTDKVNTLLLNLETDELPKKYDHFDLVLSAMCFHHLKNPSAYLKKLKSNLASNAEIVVIDLLAEDGSFHPRPQEMGVYHFGFSPENLESWAKEASLEFLGFQIIHEIEKNDKKYPILAANFKCNK